jgi:hypothetical protein
MPYFPVDDGFHSHRKAIKAGTHAIGLWTLSGSWSNDNGTDGFIPDYVAARFDPDYEALAARLVEVGLWTAEEINGEKGWLFHDWTGEEGGEKRNYTRAEVEKKRREWANRKAKSRERQAGVPHNVTRDNRVTPNGLTRDSNVTAGSAQNPPENVTRDSRVSPRVPVPVPLPLPEVQVQNQEPPVVDLSALPPAENSDNIAEEDKPWHLRSPLSIIACPEHGGNGRKIGDCVMCRKDHGNRQWFADPSHWSERDRKGERNFDRLATWAASR